MTNEKDLTIASAGLDESAEVERLVDKLAHDFNNLMTIIATLSDLAMKEAVTKSQQTYLGHIRAASLRAGKLTERLLDVCDCEIVATEESAAGKPEAKSRSARDIGRREVRVGRGELVLVVEDERWLRRSVSLALKQNGYSVTEASGFDEAVRVFERKKGEFDLLFTDMVLDGSCGVDLAARLREKRPGLRVLITSGFQKSEDICPDVRSGSFGYLQKPYEPVDLLNAIGNMLDGRAV